jgi:hypothetical protein
MAKINWRTKIDQGFRTEMVERGFVHLPGSFTFVIPLSDAVDMAVNIEQGKRHSKVTLSQLFVSYGVLHKDLAELEAVLSMPYPSTVPPPHWWHSVSHSWQIYQNLNFQVSATGWCFEEFEKPKKTAATIKSVVDSIVQVGVPYARRFDNLKAIIQELENPSDVRMRCVGRNHKLPIAYMLDNRFADAANMFSKIKEQTDASANKYQQAFQVNFPNALRLHSLK